MCANLEEINSTFEFIFIIYLKSITIFLFQTYFTSNIVKQFPSELLKTLEIFTSVRTE